MEQISVSWRKQCRIEFILKALEFSLPVLALIVACCICFFSRMPIPIKQPLILLLGSIFILIPFKTETIVALQRIIILSQVLDVQTYFFLMKIFALICAKV